MTLRPEPSLFPRIMDRVNAYSAAGALEQFSKKYKYYREPVVFLPAPACLLSPQQFLDLLQVSVYIPVLPADHKGNLALHLCNIADDLTGVVIFTGNVPQNRPDAHKSYEQAQDGKADIERNQYSKIVIGNVSSFAYKALWEAVAWDRRAFNVPEGKGDYR